MRNNYIIALLLPLLLLIACEDVINDPDWPEHEQKLVVLSRLEFSGNDSVHVICSVSKTLPVWEYIDHNTDFTVYDATVQIETDLGMTTIPHSSPDNGEHRGYITYAGDGDYTIHVSWNGLNTSATSRPVKPPVPHSAILLNGPNHDSYSAGIHFARNADPNVTYLGEARFYLEIRNRWIDSQKGNYSEGGDSRYIHPIPDNMLEYIAPITDFTSTIDIQTRITMFSREYRNYIEGSGSYYNGDDPFDPSDTNPLFSFTGDGIGFFWTETPGPWVEFTLTK
jgi:hypothetical protein